VEQAFINDNDKTNYAAMQEKNKKNVRKIKKILLESRVKVGDCNFYSSGLILLKRSRSGFTQMHVCVIHRMMNLKQDEKYFWQRDEKYFFGFTKRRDQAIEAIHMSYRSSELNGFRAKLT
jgi:hypothetical protein